ncbi:MAG TPA: response regulator [Gemmatimonadales bacterium]|nr:response regulator [Gemmatimonadales bacterium]
MAKKKILLVDDEVIITRTLKVYLDGTGSYEVRAENDPTKALKAARDFKPDLILLDVVMPDLEGGQVAEQIRGDEALKATPIIFLTSLVQREEVRQSGGHIGGFPFLAKPIDPALVIEVIESVLG